MNSNIQIINLVNVVMRRIMKYLEKKSVVVVRAFTLMEIMIVIGIIMLLATIAIPFAAKSLGKGQAATARLQIQAFESAITNFQIDTGRLPKSLDELMTNNGDKKWDGPYLNKKELPKDPWGNNYIYKRSSSNGNGYSLISYGSDGAPGGSNLAADITN
jgi:general secretion pathway protein G